MAAAAGRASRSSDASRGPAALPVIADGIPESLRGRRFWLPWRYGKLRGEKPEKLPLDPRTGEPASYNDPAVWTTFDAALDYYLSHELPGRGGVGFVPPPYETAPPAERIAVLDLDHCRCPATGEIDPVQADILRAVNSYSEASPSGTGVKTVAYADLDPNGRSRSLKGSPFQVELYRQRHYLTLTGWRIPHLPTTVEQRGDVLDEVRALLLPARQRAKTVLRRGAGFPGTDAELISQALASGNADKIGAYYARGEFCGHPSPSEALLGLAQLLAFWSGPYADRLDRLMRASALWSVTEAIRPKWDSRRGRSTWGAVLVEHAIDTCRAFYDGGVSGVRGGDGTDFSPPTQTKPYKHGLHHGTLARAWERVERGESPAGVEVIVSRDRHTQARLRRLAALCWHLAVRADGGRFFVSTTDVGDLFGVDDSTISRNLRALREMKIVRQVRPGNYRGGLAAEYVWLGVASSTPPPAAIAMSRRRHSTKDVD